MDDALKIGLAYIHQHPNCPGTYVSVLFVDFSSVFISSNSPALQIVCELQTFWQIQKLERITSRTCRISKDAPSPLCSSPCTKITKPHKTHLVKLWNLQMMVIGLIKEGHEFANRCNVEQPLWCTVPAEKVQLASEFQSAIIQSGLCTSITVWCVPATKCGKNRLKRTVRAWYCHVLTQVLTHLMNRYCLLIKQADIITADPSHPVHNLFQLFHLWEALKSKFLSTGVPFYEHLNCSHSVCTKQSQYLLLNQMHAAYTACCTYLHSVTHRLFAQISVVSAYLGA